MTNNDVIPEDILEPRPNPLDVDIQVVPPEEELINPNDLPPQNPDAPVPAPDNIELDNNITLANMESTYKALHQLFGKRQGVASPAPSRGALSHYSEARSQVSERELAEAAALDGEMKEIIDEAESYSVGNLMIEMLRNVKREKTLNLPKFVRLAKALQEEIDEKTNEVDKNNLGGLIKERFNDLNYGRDPLCRTMASVPIRYGEHPTLKGSDRFSMMRQFMPIPPLDKRFGGQPPKDHDKSKPSQIISILNDLTSIQNDMLLSETEFKIHLRSTFRDRPQELVRKMIEQGESVPSIYRSLEAAYNYSETPASARKKLEEMQPHTHKCNSLCELMYELYRLSQIASFAQKDPASRANSEKIIYIDTFLRVLPAQYRNVIECNHAQFNSVQGREMTIAEFEQMLKVYEEQINKCLRSKSSNPLTSKKDKKQSFVHAATGEFSNSHAGPKDSKKNKNKPKAKNPNSSSVVNSVSGNGSDNHQSNSGRPSAGNSQNKGKPKKQKEQKLGPHDPIPSSGHPCQLCSFPGHGTESCTFFSPEHRVPTQQPCTVCHKGHHEGKYCPFKKQLAPKN